MATPSIEAVLWDFGGVILTSPFDAFAAYEAEHGLPDGFIRQVNAANHHTNAWARLERGELDPDGFAAAFEVEARALGGEVSGGAHPGAPGRRDPPGDGHRAGPLPGRRPAHGLPDQQHRVVGGRRRP